MDYVRVTVSICGNYYRAHVKITLTVREFIGNLLTEFSKEIMKEPAMVPRDTLFYLWRKNGVNPLKPDRTFATIRHNTVLEFGIEPTRTAGFSVSEDWLQEQRSSRLRSGRVALYDRETGKLIEISSLPCILGREGHNSEVSYHMDKVSLDTVYPGDKTISRDHFALLGKDNVFYIVPMRLAADVLLNDNEMLAPLHAHPLEDEDEIAVGKSAVLIFKRA